MIEAGLAAWTGVITRSAQESQGISRPLKKKLLATAAVRRHCGETEACSLGEKEHNCRVVGTRSKEEGMATAGSGSPSAKVPKEDQDGVDMMPPGGTPAEGWDLGSAAGLDAPDRAGEAQVARDDQLRTTGERLQHMQHSKYQPMGHNGGPRHQQHKQRKAPPRAAPEQLGAAASTGDMARTEEVQASPERVSQGLGKTQTAAQRKQGRFRWCRPPRATPEQQEASADLGDTAGTEEG